MRLGVAHEQAGDETAAIDAYRRALAIDSGLAEVHNQLGIVHARRGELPAARACFEAALRARPDYSAARANLDRLSR